MKILQVTPYYPPIIGGVQYYVQSLSEALAKFDHKIEIITTNTENNPALEITQSGIQIKRFNVDLLLYRGAVSREMYNYLYKSKHYDVIHLHFPFHVGLEASVIAAKKNGIPIVGTHHGEGLVGSPLYMALSSTYSLFSRVISMRSLDRIVFLTNSYAKSIWLPNKVKDKIRVVRTGSDISNFSPQIDKKAKRNKYGIDQDKSVILFVASLYKKNYYKGLDYLLKAIAILQDKNPDICLIIVGGGGLLPEMIEFSKSLNLTDKVIFTGAVDNSDLPSFYAVADVFVLPSIRGPENSPVVVFEAMASGKPVVASDLPGVRDIVQDSKTGLLVPPRDPGKLAEALEKLLNDQEFLRTTGENARKHVEKYTWDHCAKEMEVIYTELIEQ